MESEENNGSLEKDTSTHVKPLATMSKRRSSIFRPDEDYNGSALEKNYPAEYREKLQKERKEWKQLRSLACREYKDIKIQSNQPQNFKIDKTILDKNQREFLEQDPSAEEYVKTVDDFLNNLQLYTAQQETEFKAKQLERKNLLSKISYVENVLLQHLYNGDTKEE